MSISGREAAARRAGLRRGLSAARPAAEGAQSELSGAAPRAAAAWCRVDAVNRRQEPFPIPFARKKNLLDGAENRGRLRVQSVIAVNIPVSS